MLDKMYVNKLHTWCLWSLVIYFICLATGLVLAGQFPPLAPSSSAEAILAHFQEHTTSIRIGMVLVMFGSGLYLLYVALCCHYLNRIEGHAGILTNSMSMGGFGFALMTFYPAGWWLFGSYRVNQAEFLPEFANQAAQVMQFFNDSSWLSYIGLYFIFLPQYLAIAFAAFGDKSENPVFPRWLGYFTVWVMIGYLPSQLCFFFFDGVFAWDGLLTFWLGVVLFSSWSAATYVALRRAVLRDREEIMRSQA